MIKKTPHTEGKKWQTNLTKIAGKRICSGSVRNSCDTVLTRRATS